MYEYHLVILVFWFMSCGVTELQWCSSFPTHKKVATHTDEHTRHHQTPFWPSIEQSFVIGHLHLVLLATWGFIFFSCVYCLLGVDKGTTRSSISYMEEKRYCPIFPWIYPLMPEVFIGLSSYFINYFPIYYNFSTFLELGDSILQNLFLGLCFWIERQAYLSAFFVAFYHLLTSSFLSASYSLQQ